MLRITSSHSRKQMVSKHIKIKTIEAAMKAGVTPPLDSRRAGWSTCECRYAEAC